MTHASGAQTAFRFNSYVALALAERLAGAPGVAWQALLMAVSSAARTAGFRQLIAVIGDSGNNASISLHASCGFERAGLLKQIGEKFGKPLDIVMMQRSLVG
jgi:phosphinothricin acetyltransferase